MEDTRKGNEKNIRTKKWTETNWKKQLENERREKRKSQTEP